MNLSRYIAICSIACALSACTGVNTLSSKYPFPTTLPSEKVLDTQYQRLHHDLSPIPAYRFRMMVPVEWKTLATKIEKDPAADGTPSDIAVFREPGDWMTDPQTPIKGEISVSVVNVTGNKQSPAEWLSTTLQKNAKGFTELNRHSSPSAAGEVSDVLIEYKTGSDTLITRMMAFRSGDKMFVITGSDTASEYESNAQAFNVAIATFRLDSAGKNVPTK